MACFFHRLLINTQEILNCSTYPFQIPPGDFSKDPNAKQYVYLQAQFPGRTLEKVVLVSFQSGYIFIQTDKTLYTPNTKGELNAPKTQILHIVKIFYICVTGIKIGVLPLCQLITGYLELHLAWSPWKEMTHSKMTCLSLLRLWYGILSFTSWTLNGHSTEAKPIISKCKSELCWCDKQTFIHIDSDKSLKWVYENEKKRLLICRLLMGWSYHWTQFLWKQGCTLEITNLVKLSGV